MASLVSERCVNGAQAVCVLQHGGASAEVWPAGGFNCWSWRVPHRKVQLDLLYRTPDLFTGGRPTRSGIPILFPFPNRIRDGMYTWNGKQYRLPTNDPSGKNAIHGFACQNPWRILERGSDEQSAWLTGEFRASIDAPQIRSLWPADHTLRLTYRLGARSLRLEATVTNPDTVPLPFGLGYHPYFRVSPVDGWDGDARVRAPAAARWELVDTLPTGKRLPPGSADLNSFQPVRDVTLDDVLTGLPDAPARDGLQLRGAVQYAIEEVTLEVWTSSSFRELVVFTPPHREAVCLEPYTCTTDAINLEQRDIDAGWRVLPPSATWSSVVELRLTS